MKSLCSEITTSLIKNTPIDTGRAKSNWQITYNTPSTVSLLPYVPGKYGSTITENEIRAISVAMADLRSYRLSKDVFITNNLIYIKSLNRKGGSSGSGTRRISPNFVQVVVTNHINSFNKKNKQDYPASKLIHKLWKINL